jgi:hypothetical protein
MQLVLAAGLASFNYGYMNNVISGSFGQVSFIAKFLSGANATSITDAIVSGYALPLLTSDSTPFGDIF